MIKKIIIVLVLLALLGNVASAANNTDPFSPGNAKKAFDKQDQEFKDGFTLLFGLFWLGIGSFIMICFGGSAASYSAHKSGQFADPEKKSGGAASMLAIIFIVLGLFLCLSVVKPYFGF
jgi:Mn2+/Fe2+ NRAMP family transporter